VASNNAFYANLYAKLLFDLSKIYENIEENFYNNEQYIKYSESFKTIRSIQTITDMELEFEVNKENDKRKATTKFII